MPSYEIGSLIKKLRKQKGISQEDLAYPIIDRTTLSKIESGKVVPHRRTLEYLFERLGFESNEFIKHFMVPDDLETQLVIDELNQTLSYVVRANPPEEKKIFCDKVTGLIQQLESKTDYTAHPLNMQFILDFKARLAYNMGEDDKAIALAIEALKITVPNFNENNIADYYFNMNDRNMIKLLALIYNETKQYDRAIDISYRLKENIDKIYPELVVHARRVTPLIVNLALTLIKADRHQEAYDLCEEGIQICIKSGEHKFYKGIVWYQAHAMLKLGKTEEGIELARKLYYAFDLYRVEFDKNFVRNTVLAETGVDVAGHAGA